MRELEVHGVHVLRYTCIVTKGLSILCSSTSSTVWDPYQHHLINTLKTVQCCSARRIFRDPLQVQQISQNIESPTLISHLDLPPSREKTDQQATHIYVPMTKGDVQKSQKCLLLFICEERKTFHLVKA